MAVAKAQVRVKGLYSLLMHRFPMEPVEALAKKSPEDQAEIAAHRLSSGELFVPGVAFRRALVNAGTYSKGKGRASLQKWIAACVFVAPENLILSDPDTGEVLQRNGDDPGYEIDARPVVVPATKGRIVRYRPRIEKWQLLMELEWDDTLITEDQMRRVVDDAGRLVGLLDYRPEKKGPHGRFIVTMWDKI